jgi:general secretion pathway protein F
MPNFIYRAKKNPQEIISGVVSAGHYDDAVEKILSMGCSPLEVRMENQPRTAALAKISPLNWGAFAERHSLNSVYFFVRQLADLLEAEVPVLRALDIMARQTQQPKMKTVVESMSASVKGGQSLSQAMAQHPQFFSALYVNMTAAGESSGHLTEVLERLAQLTQKELDTRAHVVSSLMYPLVVLGVGVLTMFVLLTFVLPRLTDMFNDFDAQLPLPTRIVVALSDVFSHFGWILIVVGVLLGLYFQRAFQDEMFRMKWDGSILKMPLVGRFIRDVEIGRFSRTLGTLLEGGVSITSALESVCPLVGNGVLRAQLVKASVQVREGSGLAEALQDCGVFSESALSVIAVGEESGKLHRGLLKLAHMCDQNSDQTAKTFVTLLGPLMLMLIVTFVGFIVIAMLLPIFRMNLIVN